MIDVGYLAAFLGGVLALISPCSALLLPSFFAYAFSGRTALLARTGVFLAGLVVVLVPLGAAASTLGALLTTHRGVLVTVAGWLLVVLGVVQILGGGWRLESAARFQQRMASRGGWLATVGLGAAYGLAGFCSGPILGGVLTVAAAGGSPVRGAVLLAVYAVGMAAPMFLLAALWERFDLGRRRWLRGRIYHLGPLRLHTTSTVSGLLFVAIGVLFLVFDGTAGLVGADPETDLAVQDVVARIGAAVPDEALIAALAVVVAVIVAVLLRRERRRRDIAASEARDVGERSEGVRVPSDEHGGQ